MKNRILYRYLETNHYLCTIIPNKMGINKLKVVLTEEAQAFLDAQPFKAQQKRYEKSILAIKRNSIMAQMKLIPADNMKDKL